VAVAKARVRTLAIWPATRVQALAAGVNKFAPVAVKEIDRVAEAKEFVPVAVVKVSAPAATRVRAALVKAAAANNVPAIGLTTGQGPITDRAQTIVPERAPDKAAPANSGGPATGPIIGRIAFPIEIDGTTGGRTISPTSTITGAAIGTTTITGSTTTGGITITGTTRTTPISITGAWPHGRA